MCDARPPKPDVVGSNPAAPTTLSDYDIERFWSKVDQTAGPTGCWPWVAYRAAAGYGRFRIGHRSCAPAIAHRVACAIAHGEPRPGQVAKHSCDNKPCCNPAHLSWGTQAQNIAEAVERGLMVTNAHRGPDGRFTTGVR